jgi:hypothetical protein
MHCIFILQIEIFHNFYIEGCRAGSTALHTMSKRNGFIFILYNEIFSFYVMEKIIL